MIKERIRSLLLSVNKAMDVKNFSLMYLDVYKERLVLQPGEFRGLIHTLKSLNQDFCITINDKEKWKVVYLKTKPTDEGKNIWVEVQFHFLC